MATYDAGTTGTDTKTLTASTVDTVTFTNDVPRLVIMHASIYDSTAPTDTIWGRADGQDPTVGGAGCFPIPANAQYDLEPVLNDATNNLPMVKLISSGAAKYRVQRAD